MFYDLVYTRCNGSIDITRGGALRQGGGEGVYACAPELTTGSAVDPNLLMKVAMLEQATDDPYQHGTIGVIEDGDEPGFMDDAYAYVVSDNGTGMLQRDRHIPYDLSVDTGGFSKRPNAYVNHVVVGDFSEIYPYEMLHDADVWEASDHDEAHYYRQGHPTSIPSRNIVPQACWSFDDIGAFVADGRRDTLGKAVAFLMHEMGKPASERRQLIVWDETQQDVEMWIAAIELAFSSRMAATIPFATRLRNYSVSSRYYVDRATGAYSMMQRPSDGNEPRMLAEVIGVVKADREAREPRAGDSTIAIVDGIAKTFSGEVPPAGEYVRLATAYDNSHRRFVREFMQSIDLANCSDEHLDQLADAFVTLMCKPLASLRQCSEAVTALSRYDFIDTPLTRELYGRLSNDLSRHIATSIPSSMPIINWIGKTAPVIGQSGTTGWIDDTIEDFAMESLFADYQPGKVCSLWEDIKPNPFRQRVADVIAKPEIIGANAKTIAGYSPDDAVALVEMCCHEHAGEVANGVTPFSAIVAYCCVACAKHNSTEAIMSLIDTLQQASGTRESAVRLLLGNVRRYAPKAFQRVTSGILLSMPIDVDAVPVIVAVAEESAEAEVPGGERAVVIGAVRQAKNPETVEALIDASVESELSDATFDDLLSEADSMVSLKGRASDVSLSLCIQENHQGGKPCSRSAHYAALDAISAPSSDDMGEVLAPFAPQGFPSYDESFKNGLMRFAGMSLAKGLSFGGQWAPQVVEFLETAHPAYAQACVREVISNPSAYDTALDTLANRLDEGSRVRQAVMGTLMVSGMSKREMTALKRHIMTKAGKQAYLGVVSEVLDRQVPQPSRGLFGMFRH